MPAPSSLNSGHASDTTLGKAAQQTVRPSYGLYQPQADSDDDVHDKAEELPGGDTLDRDRCLFSPQSSQQHHKASSQNYSASNIQFEDDDDNAPTRATKDASEYYADRCIPSAPHPQSKLQTRGRSVPSSTASGLYSRPQSGDEDDDDYNAPIEAYVHQARVLDPAAKTKKRATYSANSRIQQVGTHNQSYSSARSGADSESDTDEGLYSKDRDVSARASARLDPAGANDLANYLYGGSSAQPKMTKRAAGDSLPHLPPARIMDSGRAHSIVAAKQQASRVGLERETHRAEVSEKPRKTGKKKVRGAPQSGGLASSRR